MRIIPVLFLATLLFYVINITGCKQCMCCGPILAQYTCVSGIDTVIIESDPSKENNYSDSLKLYRSEGFVCTGSAGPIFPYLDMSPACGKEAIKNAEASGLECIPTSKGEDDNCSPW